MDATFDNNFGTVKPVKKQVAEDDNDSWSEEEGAAAGTMNCFEEDKGDCDEEPRDWEEYNEEDDETDKDAESEVGTKKQKPAAAKKKKTFDEYDDEDEEDEEDDEELESKQDR